ncbi:RecX family transcriptional regulator [Lichenihabitans sp. PAMC28606]|uniref:regulatory protein RecX n=1 Tax=Lichenihabitans sp. PAMC28606 TaxID=2880932 RepID=UPI001D0B0EE5|nr:RecX family transcriptional regulator [Lichenihabitans sp. PAMC28606]UDL94303.1 RecX family transcriptional regulator [Lichenihabitans sp. PAMC28606]
MSRDDPAVKPVLKPETLVRMATYYLARHSASADRLREVLARKITRRLQGDDGGRPDAEALRAMIDPVVERLTRIGLLDDAAFARGRANSLAAKGRPAWRIKADLAQAGVDADEAGLSEVLDSLDPLSQAGIWARRRRLGPFRIRDRAAHRERDIASLARAGFPVGVAKQVIDDDGTLTERDDPGIGLNQD